MLFKLISKLNFMVPKKPPEPVVEKELYIIDVLSSHRIRFVVECQEAVLDNIVSSNNMDELVEFSQEHLGDKIVSYHRIDGINGGRDNYLNIFDDANAYLKSWTNEQKFNLINRK